MKQELDADNIYAFNAEDKPIHISEAESGRRGYYCMGCKREMQAVKSKIMNRSSYFRHDAQAIKNQKKCTYSDETYRHKLAKNILQIKKQIKVPAIYKYPPNGNQGLAMLLKQSELIIADSVRNEITFYEDENGILHWGHKPDLTNKYLLIKPDVAFFDTNNQPILLIEIVATHKVTMEKLLKIKRLGIDTVQITIPKDSPQEIERILTVAERTVWVYNNLQENEEYIRITESNSEGVSSIDEIPEQLFEETFACRASQINNLIRAIEQCLESKLYTEVEFSIRSEIQRITDATKGEQKRQLEFEEEYRGICESGIETRRNEIRTEQRKVDQEYSALERRYLNKARELEKQELHFESGGEDAIEAIRKRIEIIISSRSSIEKDTTSIKLQINGAESVIRDVEQQIKNQPGILEQAEKDLRIWAGNIEQAKRSEMDGFSTTFERDRGEIEARFDHLRRELIRSVETRAIGTDEFSRKLKKLYEAIALYPDFAKAKLSLRRVLQAKQYIDEDTYKSWFK